jgi:hypothetical protein
MASLTFADLKRMANDIVLSPPEAYMSSMCSEIKFKGFDSSPTFTTPIVEIAGFGIGPAKMGWKGEALASTDKLQVPVIPTDAMSEALEEVTVQIAKRVQENLVKVRRLFSTPLFSFAWPSLTLSPTSTLCSGSTLQTQAPRRRSRTL